MLNHIRGNEIERVKGGNRTEKGGNSTEKGGNRTGKGGKRKGEWGKLMKIFLPQTPSNVHIFPP